MEYDETKGLIVVDLHQIGVDLIQEEVKSAGELAGRSSDQRKMRNFVDLRRGILYRCPLDQCGYKPLNLDHIEHSVQEHVRRHRFDDKEIYLSR